jgi:hypothetical protein
LFENINDKRQLFSAARERANKRFSTFLTGCALVGVASSWLLGVLVDLTNLSLAFEQSCHGSALCGRKNRLVDAD